MESRARYALVGGVIVAIVAFFALTLFWLSRHRDEAETRLYVAYFRRFSLAGLQVNSWVTMRGIKVGVVDSLRISHKDIEQIQVDLRLEKDTPVKEDTEAIIERNLLTGLASIDLVKSTKESPLLLAHEGEEYPVIPEGRTTLGAIQDNLPQLFDKLSQMANRLNALLSPENVQAFSQTLANMRDISQALAQRKGELAEAVSNFNALAAESKLFVQNVDKRSAEAGAALTRASGVIALEVTRMSQALSAMAEALRTTLEGYEDPGALIRGRAASARGPGEGK